MTVFLIVWIVEFNDSLMVLVIQCLKNVRMFFFDGFQRAADVFSDLKARSLGLFDGVPAGMGDLAKILAPAVQLSCFQMGVGRAP